jgi:hypothetical protein
MHHIKLNLRTFGLIFGAALLGAAWAIYNRGLAVRPYDEAAYRALIWVVFATPFAMFWGWLLARPDERWLALLVCAGVYFFSPFVAARYESCAVVSGGFSLVSCFADTQAAQQLANNNGHAIYFQAIVVVHLIAGFAIALHRGLDRSTMPSRHFARRGSEPERPHHDASASQTG